MTPAIFLDKDGTLLQDVPYNCDPRKMAFARGSREGLAELAKLRLPLIVISNQPGIALGKFGMGALSRMKAHLAAMFEEAGATLSGFYFCPHHPEGIRPEYRLHCQCRKPAPGLLMIAAERHSIELQRSWFIGDILDDVEAGRRAGCRTVLIDNGNETEWIVNDWRTPDWRAPNLHAASLVVAQQLSQQEEMFS